MSELPEEPPILRLAKYWLSHLRAQKRPSAIYGALPVLILGGLFLLGYQHCGDRISEALVITGGGLPRVERDPVKEAEILKTFPVVPVTKFLKSGPILLEPTPTPTPTPPPALQDICDANDNDGDGLVDEDHCCFCVAGARLGDANGDQSIDEMDQVCQTLVLYNKTLVTGGNWCMDVNQDGVISMDDVIANEAN